MSARQEIDGLRAAVDTLCSELAKTNSRVLQLEEELKRRPSQSSLDLLERQIEAMSADLANIEGQNLEHRMERLEITLQKLRDAVE